MRAQMPPTRNTHRMVEAILAAIAGPLAQIIENAMSDNYDKDKELQAMLDLGRAIADARLRVILAKK